MFPQGLITLVLERQRLLLEAGEEYRPLTLVAPQQIDNWFAEVQRYLMPIRPLIKHLYTEKLEPKNLTFRDSQALEDMLNMREVKHTSILCYYCSPF